MPTMDELLARRQETAVIMLSSTGEIGRNRQHFAACSLVAWPVHGLVEEGYLQMTSGVPSGFIDGMCRLPGGFLRHLLACGG